ncbi:MAG TPA: hypothetical protein VGN23_03620 [Verrucomicrobiae bacterium]|jgi:hypothetical protein
MNPNWAEENLQTIRTLMERSALYRRALAPIMLLAGVLGIVAAAVGMLLRLTAIFAFDALWLGTAVIVVIGAFLIARKQAIKDKEPFWSPPTRRVTQAIVPPLLVGLFLELSWAGSGTASSDSVTFWVLFYGCALHCAGFFTTRSVKYFGWIFLIGACAMVYSNPSGRLDDAVSPNLLMGFFFGVLHLVYGVYLYATEKGKNAA